ncbi:MAG: hypothetical protein FJW20_09700 [Acidimicrobiia bacterium]|nr:hypothetical protein [Acidimicrobiia bacterium]
MMKMKVSQFWVYVCLVFLFMGTDGAVAQVPLNPSASRVIGHPQLRLATASPNLVEGTELFNPQGVAVDATGGFVYVADTSNNRVLAWRNAAGFANGAKADLVIGQRDFLSTFPLGPGSTLSSGLNQPSAVAVDSRGNLYVADAGNNRIIRYPRPFEQPGDEVRLADFAIGQTTLSGSRAINAGGLSGSSLFLGFDSGGGTTAFRTALVFDPQGNLYVADAGNHRVLRYPAGALADGAPNKPSANLVLGQREFSSNATININDQNARINKQVLNTPSGLALDQRGRLYVVDSFSRVLLYNAPLTSGGDAARIIGIVPAVGQGQPAPALINEFSLGVRVSGGFIPPEGVFTIGNTPFVIDSPAHRILRYDDPSNWQPENVAFSPPARAFIGQDVRTQAEPARNRGGAEPTANSYLFPVHAAFSNGELFLVDSGNHRVLVLPNPTGGPELSVDHYSARRVLGQSGFAFRSPNQIDGREFQFGGSAGMAVDTRSTPPRLYVADTGNHRILGFADARRVRPGDKADLVIGQPDFLRALVNFPSNQATILNDAGLNSPVGLAVDREGNLWVADAGNSRVLRFPTPFTRQQQRADLVLGQANFTARLTDATSRTMSAPYGLAFTAEGHLLVSDINHNRVVLFTGPFTTGMAAARVFGQDDFEGVNAGNLPNRLNGPAHIAVDSDDRLYVCDPGNNRVQIFSRAPNLLGGNGPSAVFTLSRLSRPLGIVVSQLSGEIWVANSGGSSNQAGLRYPKFDELTSGAGDNPNYAVPSLVPLAVTLDGFGNLFIADAAHRVAIHFPVINVSNGANYLPRAAPGMVTTLLSRGLFYTLSGVTRVFNELPNPIPMPTVLEDLQVLIDDKPAPIYFVSPEQINFQMPNDAPSSGAVELQVVQPSVGRIVASTRLTMDISSPGFFTIGSTGTGQIAALNQDDTVNSTTNRARRGDVIQLFATGAGTIPNAPADGSPATGLTPTNGNPRVFIQSREADIVYSGLAPGLIGVWQINVKIPDQTAPNDAALVVMTMNDRPSNNPQNLNQIRATIAVQ